MANCSKIAHLHFRVLLAFALVTGTWILLGIIITLSWLCSLESWPLSLAFVPKGLEISEYLSPWRFPVPSWSLAMLHTVGRICPFSCSRPYPGSVPMLITQASCAIPKPVPMNFAPTSSVFPVGEICTPLWQSKCLYCHIFPTKNRRSEVRTWRPSFAEERDW